MGKEEKEMTRSKKLCIMLAALLIGVTSAIYIIFVLAGWLFCLAVYYTVKLM